jgi:hypothetical protein
MRHVLKWVYLLGFVLILGFLSVCGVSIVMWANANNTVEIKLNDLKNAHRVRVHSLNLWTLNSWIITGYYEVAVKNLEGFDIANWLAVFSGSSTFNGWSLYMIGWWLWNMVTAWDSAWVAGWESNQVYVSNAVIGWWQSNKVYWNASVIWGWTSNTTNNSDGWAVLGWGSNTANNVGSIVLGWDSNTADWQNSFAAGKSAKAWLSSFSWNDGSLNMSSLDVKSANIGASEGILIWTYNKLPWQWSKVNLVVSGAVKIGWDNGTSWTKWEIKVYSWCFYAYDGTSWHIFGKSSKADSNCTMPGMSIGVTCNFGKIELQEWDVVEAYSQPYSTGCDSIKRTNVKCTRETIWWVSTWVLKSWMDKGYIYPSCYKITATPTL